MRGYFSLQYVPLTETPSLTKRSRLFPLWLKSNFGHCAMEIFVGSFVVTLLVCRDVWTSSWKPSFRISGDCGCSLWKVGFPPIWLSVSSLPFILFGTVPEVYKEVLKYSVYFLRDSTSIKIIFNFPISSCGFSCNGISCGNVTEDLIISFSKDQVEVRVYRLSQDFLFWFFSDIPEGLRNFCSFSQKKCTSKFECWYQSYVKMGMYGN